MSTLHPYSIFPLGDSALTIEFGNSISRQLNARVLDLYHRIHSSDLPFSDLAPAYGSLTVFYDLALVHSKKPEDKTAFEVMAMLIEALAGESGSPPELTTRSIEVPVCYEEEFGPDAHRLATEKGITVEELIRLHSGTSYRVYMLGFLPGFAYMGDVDERIATPRHAQPRSHVHAGSVGIAGRQTGIYPLHSPGGWQIIGRTPIQLFNVTGTEPAFFRPGDEVKFYSITRHEFARYQNRTA